MPTPASAPASPAGSPPAERNWCSSRDEVRLEAVVDELRSHHGTAVEVLVADLLDGDG